ncbi:hypothetical protein pdam_00020918, partial [Pocillopora damicornis]
MFPVSCHLIIQIALRRPQDVANIMGYFAWCDRPGECARANHGIGITEAGAASFVEDGGSVTEYDFGYD